jgi:BirA family biotin operon repressor/biotin-[acetyl-CoA-carboxylase] ligase
MYREKILKLLRSSHPGFISGEALAKICGISRTMVWKHIKSLEREGFVIEAVPSRGYKITTQPDILRKADIKQGLRTRVMGKETHLLPEITSTNTLAMQMAANGVPEGTVVIAEVQSGGKGRLGRKWISPKGNLYLSVVLRPNIPIHKAPLITLMGAVAVATAIRTTCGLSANIKWPNDVLVGNKKVSGLLTEMSAEQDRIRHIVLGIGVDVNMEMNELPYEIRSLTTTLAAEAGTKINRTTLFQQILRELEIAYTKFLTHDEDVLEEWKQLNVTIGNRVTVSGGDTVLDGLAQGVDSEGRLIIGLDNGTVRTIAAGDVSIVKK